MGVTNSNKTINVNSIACGGTFEVRWRSPPRRTL